MYKVIIADDEPLILAGLRHKLDWNALGFEIIAECTDGNALYQAIVAHHPDLLLVDIQMPQITGLEVLRAIQNLYPVLVVIISGYSDFSYAQEAMRLGVVDYLLKPVATRELKGSVLKIKEQLDAQSSEKSTEQNLSIHYLRDTLGKISDDALLHKLTLSGAKKYYWIAAFHEKVSLKKQNPGEEIRMFRYNEQTLLALIHTDTLPDDYGEYLQSIFDFDKDVGVGKPFAKIADLLQESDEAYLLLETRRIKRGVYYWTTENANQSVKYYIQSVKKASEEKSGASVSCLLSELCDYIRAHRLNIKSIETIFNSLQSIHPHEAEEQPIVYMTWQEIFRKYPSADQMLAALNARLVSGSTAEINDATSQIKGIVFKVKMILQKEYAQPISLQDMVARFHIDKSYLSSQFHNEVGETFTNYLTGIRIQHACEYLSSTNLSHSKIAQLCGFSSDSYMKRIFRKRLNTTPSAYRNSITENPMLSGKNN